MRDIFISTMLMIVVLFVGCSSSNKKLSPPYRLDQRPRGWMVEMEYKMELKDYPEWADKHWQSLMFIGDDIMSRWRVFHVDVDSYNPRTNTYDTIDGKRLSVGKHAYELSEFDIVHDNFQRWKYEFFPCTTKGVWHSRYDEEDDVAKCPDCGRCYCNGVVSFSKSDGSVIWSSYR